MYITFSAFAQQPDSVAIERLKQEVTRLKKEPIQTKLASLYLDLGNRYDQRYGYNKYTLDAYFDALSIYKQLGDSAQYYNMHTVIGSYYAYDSVMGADARQHFKQALTYYQRQREPVGQLACRLGIVGTQISDKRTPAQIAELNEVRLLSRRHKQPYYESFALNLLANGDLRQQRWVDAQRHARESLNLALQGGFLWLIRVNYFYLGVERQYHNPTEAIAFFKKAIDYSRKTPNGTDERDIYRHLSESYALVGNHAEAYQYARLVAERTNTFFNSEQTKNIRLQELNVKVRELEVAKQLAEQQRQYQDFVNSVLIVGLISALVAAVVLFILRRQQILIGRQKDIISKQRIRQLEMASLRALIDGQEKERTRIARDLHDGLGAQLSRIKLFAESKADQLDVPVRTLLNQFIDDACQETRLIANDLRPHTLSAFGLLTALEDLTNKLNQVGSTQVVFEHYGALPPLDEEQSVMLYRVVQELLSNALKHAHAQQIVLQVMANDDTLMISVEDNGRGYVCTEEKAGDGIPNVKSRIDYLGGQVIWQSEPGRGTSVMISIPTARLTKKDAAVM